MTDTTTAAASTTTTAKPAGSGIKKNTLWTTPDGTHHKSQAAALQYTVEKKVKEALAASFNGTFITGLAGLPDTGVSFDDRENPTIYAEDVATFLFDNRVAILEALNQTVRTRKAGAGRKKAANTVAA